MTTEQIHLMTWCKWAQAKYPELETMGLKSEMPDICLPVPKGQYIALYIELKRIGGKPTEKQINRMECLERYGNCVAVCEGAETAEKLITAYCKQDNDTIAKLSLCSERGDFERLRKRLPKKADDKNHGIFGAVLCYYIAAAVQGLITLADIAANGTITGRSLIIALALSVAVAFRMIRSALNNDN